QLRRGDQDVRIRALGVDPAPERFDLGGLAARAEEGAGGGGDLKPGDRREGEERPARDRPGIEGQERDAHGGAHRTAPIVLPRRKYRCRSRNTTIVGRVMTTAPAATYRVLWAKRPER